MTMRPVRSPTVLASSCHVQQAAKRDTETSGAVLENDVIILLLADFFELVNGNVLPFDIKIKFSDGVYS